MIIIMGIQFIISTIPVLSNILRLYSELMKYIIKSILDGNNVSYNHLHSMSCSIKYHIQNYKVYYVL